MMNHILIMNILNIISIKLLNTIMVNISVKRIRKGTLLYSFLKIDFYVYRLVYEPFEFVYGNLYLFA